MPVIWRDGLWTLENGPLECGPSRPIVGFQSPSWAIFYQKNGPHLSASPGWPTTLPQALFFFQENDPHISGSPERPPTLPQALFFSEKRPPYSWKPTVGFESPPCAMNAHIPKAPFPRSIMRSPKCFQKNKYLEHARSPKSLRTAPHCL